MIHTGNSLLKAKVNAVPAKYFSRLARLLSVRPALHPAPNSAIRVKKTLSRFIRARVFYCGNKQRIQIDPLHSMFYWPCGGQGACAM